MELNFEQVNGAYVARVTVDGAYAVHLERAGRCPLAVLQRHGEQGQYVPCPLPAVTGTLAPAVVDVSLDHCVYPVEVEIVSGLLPQVATLTRYAGGGGGGGIPEAPVDGKTYGRKDAAWAEVADPGVVADLSAAQEQQGEKIAALETADAQQDGKIEALETADTAQDERLTTAETDIAALEGADAEQDARIEALEGGLADVEGKVEAMPAAYTLDSSLFHITDESTSEQIRDALEASGGFEAIVEALKRGDALYLHYSGEGWDGTYTESGINLVYGYVTEDDNGTTNLCLYFTRKNNIDVYDIYHYPDDDTYSARNWDYDLSVLDSDEYPLSTLGQKYQQLEASQAQQDAKITALETADTAQDGKIEALETASAGHDEAIGELETKVEGLEAGGGFPEAPADGQLYGRRDKAWAAVPDPSADIAALEGRMDTAEGEIDALETADAQQDTKIAALETAQTQQDSEIDDLTGRVTTLEEQGGSASLVLKRYDINIDAMDGGYYNEEVIDSIVGGGGMAALMQDIRNGAYIYSEYEKSDRKIRVMYTGYMVTGEVGSAIYKVILSGSYTDSYLDMTERVTHTHVMLIFDHSSMPTMAKAIFQNVDIY